jgi:hypothetical protein
MDIYSLQERIASLRGVKGASPLMSRGQSPLRGWDKVPITKLVLLCEIKSKKNVDMYYLRGY